MAFPSSSDAPTTSPSHGLWEHQQCACGVYAESPSPILEKHYVLVHPRLWLCTSPVHGTRCVARLLIYIQGRVLHFVSEN